MKAAHLIVILAGIISAYPVAKAMVGRARKEDYHDFLLTKIGISPDMAPRLNFAIHFVMLSIILSGIILGVAQKVFGVG